MRSSELKAILTAIQQMAIDAVDDAKEAPIKITITVSCEEKWVQTIVARERPPKL